MDGKQLLEWLLSVGPDALEGCEVVLETPGGTFDLVTAKVYDENHDGQLDKIYLVHK